jgi:hypothetical protein
VDLCHYADESVSEEVQEAYSEDERESFAELLEELEDDRESWARSAEDGWYYGDD